ncbi:MAG: hypothetical protein ACD_52C00128G0003 [uncultured bacterium]|nr:MAG: hypothetical protein ACD_52C00128G0003 [uncultured bacterium]
MKRDHILTKVRGQVLIIAIIFLAVILIISATLFSKVSSFLRFGNISAQASQATTLAEAGVDNTVWLLNENAGSCPAACTTETTLGTVGTFKVTVVDNSPNLKTITSTGYIPNSTNPKSKRTVKVQLGIDSTTISFHYAAQVGVDGINMKNNSTITGSGGVGNVYSNGNITGSGSSVITGDAFAVGTISSPDPWVQGTKQAGATPMDMPVKEADLPAFYQYWKTKANINNDPITCSPTCTISSDTSIGPQQYNGNLVISNNAIVTMNGPVYVTGNFSMTQGGTTLQLNPSFGSFGTTFIADGTIDLRQGGKFLPTSANPKGYILVVTTSTLPNAVSINQSGETAIFYALSGGAELEQSAGVTSLVANHVEMENSATLTYDSGLSSASFTSGPGASWVIKKGTYKQIGSP